MLTNKQMEQFAELAVKIGVNMQKDQIVVIRADIKVKDFAHTIAQKAYEHGALYVHMQWRDEDMSRINMLNASQEVLSEVPEFAQKELDYYIDNKVCLISIMAGDPNIMSGCDANKMSAVQKATSSKTKRFREATMSNYLRWTIVSVPTTAWAKKIFPNDTADVAVDKLWNAIGKVMRLDADNPTQAWRNHITTLKNRAQFLNNCNFEYLHLTNARGTNLTIGLAEQHVWEAAEELAQDGINFTANMPTEEIFTAPHNKKIDGVVVNALPLVYNGNVIDNFSVTFKNGKVVDFSAEKGYDVLKGIIQSDDGASSLGEVALIGKHSPIAESGILFYNTLFDENASCHLAFGASYPTTTKDGNDIDDKEMQRRGMNNSITHVDFMIGTPDLNVDGIGYDGKVTPLFRDGEWII